MRAVVQSGAMPLPPVQMDGTQRDLLLAWFDAGAPSRPASDTCSDLFVDGSVGGTDGDTSPGEGGGDEGDAGSDKLEAGADVTEGSAPEAGALDGGTTDSDAPADSNAADCGDLDACPTDGVDSQAE